MFYTNDVDSQNNVIMNQMRYVAQELPRFFSSMKSMISERKLRKYWGILSRWRVHLSDSRNFFQMSKKQCQKAIKAVFTTPLQPLEELPLQDDTSTMPSASKLYWRVSREQINWVTNSCLQIRLGMNQPMLWLLMVVYAILLGARTSQWLVKCRT